jgi:hypothetical protein
MRVDLGDTQFLDKAIVYKTESVSSPGQFHYTMLLGDGEIECSCKGWQYTRGCKHLKAFHLDNKGKAVLEKWSGLTHNQAFVLTILSRSSASSRDPVWWPLNVNQVRGLLRRLRTAGLVEITDFRRSSHVYSITEMGRRTVQVHQQGQAHDQGQPPAWE